VLSLAASLAMCCSSLVHHCLQAWGGLAWRRLWLLASLARVVADSCVFLVAILASVGWAISSAKLPDRQRFLGLAALVEGLSALCELQARADGVGGGLGLAGPLPQAAAGPLCPLLRVLGFSWFAYQMGIASDEGFFELHRGFYVRLSAAATVWLLGGPVSMLFALLLPAWHRFRAVAATDLASRLAAQTLLAWLFCGPLSPIATPAGPFARGPRPAGAGGAELAQPPDGTPLIYPQDRAES